jgi:Peptidase family M23/Palmitoyl protein thioesterase
MRIVLAAALGALSFTGAALAAPPGPPTAAPDPGRPWLIPPVDGVVAGRFHAPDGPYGAGHRGIDYAVPPGTPVRAAGDGRVSFAGFVPGGNAVTIEHSSGMATTYSLLSNLDVSEGDLVAQGHWIGSSHTAHRGSNGGLHFGVVVEGTYVDPEDHLGPLDVAGAIRLTRLPEDEAAPAVGTMRPTPFAMIRYSDERDLGPGCRTVDPRSEPAAPPNENVAVVIAGIASKTLGGASSLAFGVPSRLGYVPERVYRFSYEGVDGPRHHEPYERTDTYRGMEESAGRLASLMLRIARDHPGAAVDIVAHSQGGIVARTYLERAARAWQRGLPQVEHLVTFATPHHGTEAAALGSRLSSSPFGLALTKGASWLSDRGLPIPDPDSPALGDLGTYSPLIEDLARQDVLFGTRVLSLTTARDLMVPAHRAVYRRDRFAVVDSDVVLSAHSAILLDDEALALAHHFLRDAGRACAEGMPSLPLTAGAIELAQRWGPAAVRLLRRGGMRTLVP